MAEALTIPGANSKDDGATQDLVTVSLSVENMRCGGCMSAIERALRAVPGVTYARANLSAKRADVTYDRTCLATEDLVEALTNAGFNSAPLVKERDQAANTDPDNLLRRLAVAGFGAANIMLLSVAVWAGLASDMNAAVQTLFHWLSALIAIPVVAYSGQPFFRSALSALAARRLNMDVPISLGILLATAMSLFQTSRGTEQVYFDAAVMLTFFLLIGRYLDESVRSSARGAAQNLLAFKALTATTVDATGAIHRIDAREVKPGMRIIVPRGERIPVDGQVATGNSTLDEGIITGETIPRPISRSDAVYAGAINLSAPVELIATASSDTSLLSEIANMMQAAEQNRGRYRRLADRAASIYAPAVHILGAATFTGWLLFGAPWDEALTYAIAVLIITCPCALALAVPAVQVAASSRLFSNGVILKTSDGLERLADVNAVVFDKTGTLTTGTMHLANASAISDLLLATAAELAAASSHPYARAVVAESEARGIPVRAGDGVEEIPGAGLIRRIASDKSIALGSAAWLGITEPDIDSDASLWLRDREGVLTPFQFRDGLRLDARQVAESLAGKDYYLEILSGDRSAAVSDVAEALKIRNWSGDMKPDQKLRRIDELKSKGYRVLMVGDGINDAPALAAGRASLSPSSAADITQTAADAVFQGQSLNPVLRMLAVAKAARSLSMQNFAIALAYNAVCVPLAAAGFVTPLIAALAMSSSSIAVSANAMRMHALKLDQSGERQ